QAVDQHHARRFAHVVGARLEGQPPDSEGTATEVAAVVGGNLVEQGVFLLLVARFNRLQQLGFEVDLVGDVDQRLDVLREARAAITAAGIDEVVADALVGTDTQAHVLHVHIQPFAEPGDFVHEGNLGRQHGVGGVLGHFRIANAHEHGARAVADEGRVDAAHDLPRMLVVGTDYDPVGVHEIVDRRALLEELGVGDHRELHVHAARFEAFGDGGTHQVRGTHRHGGFVHHDGRAGEVIADLPGHFQHVAQIRRAILAGRRADGDEEHFGLFHRLAQRGGEMQATRGVIFADDGFQPRLVDWQDALLEVGDLLLVDIDAVDRIAHLRDAGPCHEADVATPYDRDVHYRFLVLDVVQPCRSPPRLAARVAGQ